MKPFTVPHDWRVVTSGQCWLSTPVVQYQLKALSVLPWYCLSNMEYEPTILLYETWKTDNEKLVAYSNIKLHGRHNVNTNTMYIGPVSIFENNIMVYLLVSWRPFCYWPAMILVQAYWAFFPSDGCLTLVVTRVEK